MTFQERALALINAARHDANVAPLERSAALEKVAQDRPFAGCGGTTVKGRAVDMGERNFFSHTVKDCGTKSFTDMLSAAGINAPGAHENLGYRNALDDELVAAEALHNWLMGDDDHRHNILDPASTHVGIGVWHSPPGVAWTGDPARGPLTRVFLTTQIFATNPTGGGGGLAAAAGSFHVVTPSRILDTRIGLGAPGPLGPGATMILQVGGRGGIPAASVAAVVMNVTVTGPDAPSFLTVFPSDQPRPLASNLNFTGGRTVPNLVAVMAGAGGQVSIFNAAGTTQVIADVAGWFDDGTAPDGGARFHPVDPVRILDTRTGNGAPAAPLGAGASMNLQVAGRGGVPPAGAGAVILNVTATVPTQPSFLTLFPTGAARPVTSNVNVATGQTVPNLVVAKLGASGQTTIFNAAGDIHVIADVAGWFDDGTAATGGHFHPVVPNRVLDTRLGNGAPQVPIGPGATVDLQVTGRAGVPPGAAAVVMNVTATQPTAASFLTVFPTGSALPVVSNLNVTAGLTVANLVTVKLGAGGQASIFNAQGSTHVIADIAGWFDAG
jgi:hypothetical protein